jgi:GT2 family glycosyltransferase
MDSKQQRSIKQRLTRQAKIDKASKTPYANRYGMTPQQIHKALKKTKPSKVIVRGKKERTKPSPRPKKIHRSRRDNRSLLLEVPNATIQHTVRYPSPKWFETTEKAEVSVIIPLYKSSSVLKDLIASWDLNESLRVEAIFVDDACPHVSREHVLALWSRRQKELKKPVGKLLFNQQNQGFGVSCNLGAQHATGEYLIFLNADTVLTSGWIRPLVRTLRKPEVGIAGPLILKHGGIWKDTIDSAGSQWDWDTFKHIGKEVYNHTPLTRPFSLDNMPKDLLQVQEREMMTGACLAIRKELFDQIGGFNPNYRIGYWEDSELCMAIREKGYSIMYQPNSKIYHKGSHSQSGGHKYAGHNTNYFRNKWVNSGRIDPLVDAPRKEPMKNVSNILLKRQSANGDVLVASAVASALKKKYPHCKIMFHTHCKGVIENHPHIDKVIDAYEVSERTFELFYNFDMAYEFRPQTNMLEAFADIVGVDVKDCELHLPTKAVNVPEDYIVFHVARSKWAGRVWSPLQFEVLSANLRKRGRKVVCVGGAKDHRVTSDLDLLGRTTIPELSHVIKHAKMFVGVDSFPMHIAQAFKVPGVCFFGSINPATRLINDCIHPVTAPTIDCLGCHHRQPMPATVTVQCERDSMDCVNNVSQRMMFEKAEEVWNTTV